MEIIQKIIRRFRENPWLAYGLVFFGVVLYFLQAWVYAHIQTSFLDEGGFLHIGDLYLRGVLRPFQDYGPPRWYSPLSYLLPGLVEKWFGAGLLTGRLFSVFCGMLMLIPLILSAWRFGGKWWSAAIVWSLALTPISTQVYSLAISEALVACLLAWSLYFVLGEKRPLWQIMVGSILAGLTVMTRQNLFPLPLLLVIYVFWQHGKKAGWWALAGSLLPILLFHILYWPNILQLWAVWLPASLTPFLNSFRFPAAEMATINSIDFGGRLSAFLEGFRFHYFTLVGFIVCLFLWPRSSGWKNQTSKRSAYFLAALFIVLVLLHAWVSFLSPDQTGLCTFCFTPYLSFFDITALLLIVISFPSWKKKVSNLVQAGAIGFALLLSPALGYASFDRFGSWLLNIEFPAFTRGLDPRTWVPFITLWDILSNKFHQDFWTSRANVPIVVGFGIGIVLLILVRVLFISLVKMQRTGEYSFGTLVLLVILGLGIWLSPLMGGSYRQDGICKADIPQTYQQIGDTLSSIIPAGSLVYWEARTAVPLLYAPEIEIHYPQVYGIYSFRIGGDSQQLLRYGLWNDALARQWRSEAAFVVTEANGYQIYHPGWDLDTTQYEEFQTVPANPCDPNSYLVIYKRKPLVINP